MFCRYNFSQWVLFFCLYFLQLISHISHIYPIADFETSGLSAYHMKLFFFAKKELVRFDAFKQGHFIINDFFYIYQTSKLISENMKKKKKVLFDRLQAKVAFKHVHVSCMRIHF